MYDQGSEFIGNEFIKYIIKTEYSITAKPITSVNPMFNAVLEWIHHVLINLSFGGYGGRCSDKQVMVRRG